MVKVLRCRVKVQAGNYVEDVIRTTMQGKNCREESVSNFPGFVHLVPDELYLI